MAHRLRSEPFPSISHATCDLRLVPRGGGGRAHRTRHLNARWWCQATVPIAHLRVIAEPARAAANARAGRTDPRPARAATTPLRRAAIGTEKAPRRRQRGRARPLPTRRLDRPCRRGARHGRGAHALGGARR